MITIRREKIAVADLANMTNLCISQGCNASFKGEMPAGWRWLIHYFARRPELHSWSPEDWVNKAYVDACLCPEHYRAMVAQFKDMSPAVVTEPSQGRA